jgi:hypothetical protein
LQVNVTVLEIRHGIMKLEFRVFPSSLRYMGFQTIKETAMQMPRFIMVTLCLIFPSWGQAQTPPPTGAEAQQGATQNQGVKPVPIPGQNQLGSAQTAAQGTPASGQGQIGGHSQGGTPAQNIGPGQAGQPGLNIGPEQS